MENYKQIKSDLDELRLLVEKSELWVYKSKKDLPSERGVKKITPGLVGLRKDGGSSKEPESTPRKDSLEQESVTGNASQDPHSSDSEGGPSTKVSYESWAMFTPVPDSSFAGIETIPDIGLLFTNKNGDISAISETLRRCAAPRRADLERAASHTGQVLRYTL